MASKRSKDAAEQAARAKNDDIDYFVKACRFMGTKWLVHIASAPEFEGRRNLGTLYDCLLEGDVVKVS